MLNRPMKPNYELHLKADKSMHNNEISLKCLHKKIKNKKKKVAKLYLPSRFSEMGTLLSFLGCKVVL